MPQVTTAFTPDFVTAMRRALDAATDRVPVPSRTPATKAKMGSAHRQVGPRRHQGRAPARDGGGGRRHGARALALKFRAPLKRQTRNVAHFAFASSASRASLKALNRSLFAWKAFCARSCSVMALAASASLKTLRASRSAGVITFRSNVSLMQSLIPMSVTLRRYCSPQ